MKYRYREPHEMKDSGIEWLGMIPKDWEVSKVKYHFYIGRGRVISQEELVDNGLYPVYSSQTLNNGCLGYINTYDFTDKLLTWTTDGANAGTIFIRSGKYNCTNVCGTLKIKNPFENLEEWYYYYLDFSTKYYKRPDTNGAKIMNNEMANISTIKIEKKIQQKIADFLDKKCEEFDSVIAKKETLINKLEEAKKSLISEVVTGKVKVIEKENGEYGIIKREDHEMKDSGVEWLGMIPKEWRTSKIKYNTYVKGRIGWQGLKSDEFIEVGAHLVTGTDFRSNSINWETCYRISEERYKEAPTIHLRNGDLLITKDGTIGKLAIVESCPEQAVLNSGVFVTRCLNLDYLTKFMFYILDSKIFSTYIDINKTGSTILHLYQETFVKFSYPLPNLTIQNNIIKFLDEKCSQFDITIEKQKEIIEKLKSAKQSLISEAVTGKIEIL